MGYVIILSILLCIYWICVFFELEVYECFGILVDCVKLVKYVVIKDCKVDFCLLGINYGSNVVINIIYSGIFLVVMEVLLEGIFLIGFFLLDYCYEVDFSVVRGYIKVIIEYVFENGMVKGSLLNVNIFKLFMEEIKGIKVCC